LRLIRHFLEFLADVFVFAAHVPVIVVPPPPASHLRDPRPFPLPSPGRAPAFFLWWCSRFESFFSRLLWTFVPGAATSSPLHQNPPPSWTGGGETDNVMEPCFPNFTFPRPRPPPPPFTSSFGFHPWEFRSFPSFPSLISCPGSFPLGLPTPNPSCCPGLNCPCFIFIFCLFLLLVGPVLPPRRF